MKISLSYKPVSAIEPDLFLVILDETKTFHAAEAGVIKGAIDRARALYADKRIKREYVCTLGGDTKIATMLAYSTSLNKAYPLPETIKTFVARALRFAKDYQYT